MSAANASKPPILVWDFYDAPPERQALSTNGGDEDYIAFVRDGVTPDAPTTTYRDEYTLSVLLLSAINACDEINRKTWPEPEDFRDAIARIAAVLREMREREKERLG